MEKTNTIRIELSYHEWTCNMKKIVKTTTVHLKSRSPCRPENDITY